MSRQLRGAVVVVTGASSGIGRAAAARFDALGSRLVLAARAEAPLTAVADTCREAIPVPTDVRDERAVTALAEQAIERFGRIDVWVNGAGVMACGPFEAVPSEIFRQVIETNLLGQVHGARAVARQRRTPVSENGRIDGESRTRHRRVPVDAFLAGARAALRSLAPRRYRHRRHG
jgi:NADP-dependent 3-hydroxy acid dehydrogenase YdfG